MRNNRNKILQWAEAGQFEGQDLARAIKLVRAEPNSAEWLNFLKKGGLWSTVIFLSAGVIFYFAFNWQNMGRFTKFALIEMIMLLSTLAYVRISTSKLLSSVSLMGITLFTGALLALVGQTYQTGADPWQLFATWSFLMLPWAVVARASSVWIVWLILVNLSLVLYLSISHTILGLLVTKERGIWIFSLLNTLLLLVFESYDYQQAHKKQANETTKKSFVSNLLNHAIGNRYVNQLSAIFAGFGVTLLAIWSVFESQYDFAGLLFYSLWITTAFYIYRYKIRDLFILSAGSLSVIVVVISLLIKMLDSRLGDGGFLMISFAIIGLSSLAGIGLRNLSKEFSQRRRDNEY